jgi:transposase
METGLVEQIHIAPDSGDPMRTEYYFLKKRSETDDSASREAKRLDTKRTDRRTHFLHTLSKDIIAECVERGVGTIVVGDLGGIRNDENGTARNWGDHGKSQRGRESHDFSRVEDVKKCLSLS